MDPFADYRLLFGDIHNHCGISYGHGSLEDALANARERLDFVSITGHAHWPDMPEPNERLQPVIDFHLEGFAKLKAGWQQMLETLRAADEEDRFVVFPAFEVHFCATGDRNILYKDLDGEILYPNSLEDLHNQLRALRERGVDTLAQPHHVGYKRGMRGIDWNSFSPEFAPVVEMVSMHGCSESDESPRPFLHVMGPCDGNSTIRRGLSLGHVFGFTGGTDHHSAHPGSYGHGLTGLWAADCTREAIWDAFYARRSFALTGDKMDLRFAVNGNPMGAIIEHAERRHLEIGVRAGGTLDALDVIKNGRLLRRFSQTDFSGEPLGETLRTKLFLELGWGPRHEQTRWDVTLGVEAGRILGVEPRFRGRQVVSPLEDNSAVGTYHTAHVEATSERSVSFTALGESNPNNFTPNTQGVCLEVECPPLATVTATVNGREFRWKLEDLLAGSCVEYMQGLESPALRMHRVPLEHEFCWRCELDDAGHPGDYYYVRVRQQNDQWAWSSPVFVQED